MTGERVAIIDLGSNTFHLLICEINKDGSWGVILKERIYVRLASGGVEYIDDGSVERGLDAMTRFAEQILSYNVKHVRAIGTAALREASNGKEMADTIFAKTGLKVEIIDGQKEAEYILKGIKSCIPPLNRPGLIMDIGGGSVEFILFSGEKIIFKGSYKIGVAVLFRRFHLSDPIHPDEIRALEHFLEGELAELIKTVRGVQAYYLVGASGSFEVIHDVLPRVTESTHWAEMDHTGIIEYLDGVIATDMKSRRLIPEIPIERLDYIVVAYLLIRYILKKAPPGKLYYCDYALKEGVLVEMIDSNKFRYA